VVSQDRDDLVVPGRAVGAREADPVQAGEGLQAHPVRPGPGEQDFERAITFLVTDAASFAHGAILPADGGGIAV
jgi:NAD(P)-dependent dehydrogenase (short-subunit alcohol dehydrogenase family)